MKSDMVDRALIVAFNAHEGQVREFSGDPYIVHPIRMAAKFSEPELKTVALLHDVVEDTPVTLKWLADLFPPEIVDAVDALTKRDGEDYFARIERARNNPLARPVKIEDLLDNTKDLPVDDARRAKYADALKVLVSSSKEQVMSKSKTSSMLDDLESVIGKTVRVAIAKDGFSRNHFDTQIAVQGVLENKPDSNAFRVLVDDNNFAYFNLEDVVLFNPLASVPTIMLKIDVETT